MIATFKKVQRGYVAIVELKGESGVGGMICQLIIHKSKCMEERNYLKEENEFGKGNNSTNIQSN